jgi:hypothetical protein
MTLIYAFFTLPFAVACAVLIHRMVQIQFAEPVCTVTLDRTSVMKQLLAKGAGVGSRQ